MTGKRFQRTVEAFTCMNCGKQVQGTGYTNHCPACLWSRHVDVNPGDRAEWCCGMMPPERIEIAGAERIVVHRCLSCGTIRRNRCAEEDDLDAIIAVMRG